jgi:hypothetical protein
MMICSRGGPASGRSGTKWAVMGIAHLEYLESEGCIDEPVLHFDFDVFMDGIWQAT